MKIKHFAGYGYVNARKIAKDTSNGRTVLVVEVTGEHEWGLIRENDHSLVKNWLVDRFDKTVKDMAWYSLDYTVINDSMPDEDRAIYTFVYPSKEER